MRDIDCKELAVVVLTPAEQQALLHTSQLDPWNAGGGTALVLPMTTFEEMQLPPVARYALPRTGMCIYGYTPHLTWLLKEAGGSGLAWWGWPEAGVALLAAGWAYQRALDDPLLRAVVCRLFSLSSSPPAETPSTPLTPLTLPVFRPGVEQPASQDSAWLGVQGNSSLN
jgi:hypothetical protein